MHKVWDFWPNHDVFLNVAEPNAEYHEILRGLHLVFSFCFDKYKESQF